METSRIETNKLSDASYHVLRLVVHGCLHSYENKAPYAWLKAAFDGDEGFFYECLEALAGEIADGDDVFEIKDAPLRLNEIQVFDESTCVREPEIVDVRLCDKHAGRFIIDLVPSIFHAALSSNPDISRPVRRTRAFQDWLQKEWADPTLIRRLKVHSVSHTPKADAPKAKRPASRIPKAVSNTTEWITRLQYTAEQAEAERKRIDESDLAQRTKSALKAHIGRRTLA